MCEMRIRVFLYQRAGEFPVEVTGRALLRTPPGVYSSLRLQFSAELERAAPCGFSRSPYSEVFFNPGVYWFRLTV